jgi:OOP family OmpA-OmpF porin
MKIKAIFLAVALFLPVCRISVFSDAYTNKKYSVVFQSKVFFDVSKSVLDPDAVKTLEGLLPLFKTFRQNQIVIEGYADSSGAENTNKSLSLLRAKAVYNFLLTAGIDKNRLHFTGFGTLNAQGDNETQHGRKNNRRAEIIVLKFNDEN